MDTGREFIISTSGRASSLLRYQKLLQEVLHLPIDYKPFTDENPVNPERYAAELRKPGARGGAISKDIKFKVIPFLDKIDEVAQKVQSVNTVICEDGELVGYNTDVYGFECAIKKGIEDSGIEVKTAVVYGYGGVFNVVYHVLNSLGITVYVTGRRKEIIDKRVKEFNLDEFKEPCDLFVNAAPVSDFALEDVPGFLEALRGSKMVFDHHMPGEKLKEYCEENDVFYVSGKEMYYPQMYKQWELFLKGIVDPKDIPSLIEKAENLTKES